MDDKQLEIQLPDGRNASVNLEWLKMLNMTMEDVDYIMNLSIVLKNRHRSKLQNDDDSIDGDLLRTISSCYCNGTMRNLANLYRNAHGYASLLVCLFGTMANLFNIIVLTRKKMASAPFAYILTWLAITDMLLMIEYIPFVGYMYLGSSRSKIEKFSYEGALYILIHTHLSQVLHTISICLTLTLAFWRYNAIR